MGKYQIEVKQLIEPFVYQTPTGIHQIYNVDHYQCPQDTIDVLQWGDIQWTSMKNMFLRCDLITTFSATDNPNLSQVTDMSGMFRGASNFNQDISNWDVSNVTDMIFMFSDCPIQDKNKPQFT